MALGLFAISGDRQFARSSANSLVIWLPPSPRWANLAHLRAALFIRLDPLGFMYSTLDAVQVIPVQVLADLPHAGFALRVGRIPSSDIIRISSDVSSTKSSPSTNRVRFSLNVRRAEYLGSCGPRFAKRVVTLKQIDDLHGTAKDAAFKQYDHHRDRYVAGVDYFSVSHSQSSEFRRFGIDVPNWP